MIFEYYCKKCEGVIEKHFPIAKADKQVKCHICGELANRHYGGMSFILKGTGWPGKAITFNRDQTEKNERAGKRMLTEHEPPPKLIDQR